MKDVRSKRVLLGGKRFLNLFFASALKFSLFFSLSITSLFHLKELFHFTHSHIVDICFEFQVSLHFSEIVSIPLLWVYLDPL